MNLFIDTETTGLPDFNKRASDPEQPHLVVFAALEIDGDGNEVKEHNLIVKPDGWIIPPEVVAVHGITTEMATEKGIPEKEVAALAFGLVKAADQIIAHNLTFDKFMLRIAARRHGVMADTDDEWWKMKPSVCTMKLTTDICKLPKADGRKGFKYPKLSEAIKHLFDEEHAEAHNALADVRACARIFAEINKTNQKKEGVAV